VRIAFVGRRRLLLGAHPLISFMHVIRPTDTLRCEHYHRVGSTPLTLSGVAQSIRLCLGHQMRG